MFRSPLEENKTPFWRASKKNDPIRSVKGYLVLNKRITNAGIKIPFRRKTTNYLRKHRYYCHIFLVTCLDCVNSREGNRRCKIKNYIENGGFEAYLSINRASDGSIYVGGGGVKARWPLFSSIVSSIPKWRWSYLLMVWSWSFVCNFLLLIRALDVRD